MPEVQDIRPQSAWLSMQPTPPPLPQTDPDMQTYANMQANMARQQALAQQQGAGNILANLSLQKSVTEQPTQTNLRPLMGLVDAWTGSKFNQAYETPETPAQRAELLSKLQGQVEKTSGTMNEQQVQVLKAQLETQMQKENKQLQLDSVRAQRDTAAAIREQGRGDKMSEQSMKHLETAQKGWQSDPIATDAGKKMEEVGHAKDLLDDALTNPAAAAQVPITFARLAVPGRINETEIRAFGGSKKLSDQLDQIYKNAQSGTMTQDNHDYLMKVAQAAEESSKQTLANRAALHAKQYSRVSGKTPEDSIMDVTGGTYGPEVLKAPEQPKAQPANKYEVGQIIPDGEGHRWKFMGGDQTDQRNYQEVK